MTKLLLGDPVSCEKSNMDNYTSKESCQKKETEESNDKTIKESCTGCDSNWIRNAQTENSIDHSSNVVIEVHCGLDSLLVPKSISFSDHILEFDKSLYSDDNASLVAMPELDDLLSNT